MCRYSFVCNLRGLWYKEMVYTVHVRVSIIYYRVCVWSIGTAGKVHIQSTLHVVEN